MHQLELAQDLLDNPEGDPASAAELVHDTLETLEVVHPETAQRYLPEARVFRLPHRPGGMREGLPNALPGTLDAAFRPRGESGTLVLDVAQCRAIAIPRTYLDRLWLQASMSECSLLWATGPTWAVAAHIGFSFTHEASGALHLARQFGCDALSVICAHPRTHALTPYPCSTPRDQPADYAAAGCRTHIYRATSLGRRAWRGLAYPVIARDTLYLLRGDTLTADFWQGTDLARPAAARHPYPIAA